MRDSPWATAGVDASSKPVWSQLSLELRRLIASFGVLLRAAHSQYSLLATAAAAADAPPAAAKPPLVSDDVQRLCGLLILQLLRKAESAVVDAVPADAAAAAPAAHAPADGTRPTRRRPPPRRRARRRRFSRHTRCAPRCASSRFECSSSSTAGVPFG